MSSFRASLRVEPSYLIRRKSKFKLPHILCVLGPVASGKTEATSVLRDDYGYAEENSGKILAKLMGIPAVPKTPREEFSTRAESFIARVDGPEALARALWESVSRRSTQRILVDGIRNYSTLAEFRKAAGNILGSRYCTCIHLPT